MTRENAAALVAVINWVVAWLACAALLVGLPFLLFLSTSAHAEFDAGQVATLEALATKWERDAATLMSGDVVVGGRQESMGRALGFMRAADDIRLLLNRPIARTRANQPQPWPPSDVRGTKRLADLILPGYTAPGASVPVEPPRAPPVDPVGPPELLTGFERAR